jgi:nitroreductase
LDQEFIAQAAVVLVFCACPSESAAKYGSRGKELYCVQDATIACSYAQLRVADLHLGACWVGAFDTAQVSKVLHLSNAHHPVALLPIGRAARLHAPRHRKHLDEVVVWM